MASVRMTMDLRSQLKREAVSAWDKVNQPIKPTPDEQEFMHQAFLDSNYVAAANETLSSMEKLSTYSLDNDTLRRCKQHVRDLAHKLSEIKYVCGTPNHSDSGERNRYTVDHEHYTFKFDTPRLFPCIGDSWSQAIYTADLPSDRVEKANSMIHKYHTAREEHYTKRKEFEAKIKMLLEKCNTVKQAIEAWPGIEKLLPDEVIRKMHVKQTRKQRAAAVRQDIDFDATEANQAILTSNLLGL